MGTDGACRFMSFSSILPGGEPTRITTNTFHRAHFVVGVDQPIFLVESQELTFC